MQTDDFILTQANAKSTDSEGRLVSTDAPSDMGIFRELTTLRGGFLELNSDSKQINFELTFALERLVTVEDILARTDHLDHLLTETRPYQHRSLYLGARRQRKLVVVYSVAMVRVKKKKKKPT